MRQFKKKLCESKYPLMLAVATAKVVVVAIVVALLMSCDAHDDHYIIDTSMKVGHVLCTDGMVHTVEDCVALEKEPIAVVFHIKSSDDMQGSGYAVYLYDIAEEALADTIDASQGTSTNLSAYDGNTNTFALYSSNNCGSPAADAVFDMWKYGQSAFIPSVAEMRLLYAVKAKVNSVIEECGGTLLSDEPNECWYWTSTEVEGQESAKAWLFSMSSGAIQETPKDQPHKVRPVVEIND